MHLSGGAYGGQAGATSDERGRQKNECNDDGATNDYWGGGGGVKMQEPTTLRRAYCTIWALVAMLLSFRALMALTILFLLLLVEGWDENANTQSEHTD